MAILVCDPEGRLLAANDAAGELIGRPKGELRGRSYWELVHADDVSTEEGNVRMLLAGEVERYQVTERWPRPDGEVRSMTVIATRSRSGAERVIIRRIADVTEHLQAELERDRFFDLSVDGIAVVGFDGRFQKVNPAFLRTLGWSAEELIGQSAIDLFHPEDLPDLDDERQRLAGGQLTATYEVRVRARDGSYRWLRAATSAVPDEQLIYAWTVDVTERHLAERLLQQREAQLAEAQRIASLASWEWNGDTDEITWSEELWRILDLQPRPGPVTVAEFMARVHPDDRRYVAGVIATPVARRPGSVEFRVLTAAGDERTVELRAYVDSSVPGCRRVVGTLQDVTRWRAAEAAVRESEERFRRMFDEGPTGIVIADTQLRFLQVNGAFASMVGRRAAELVGRSVNDVTHPDDAHLGTELGRRALDGEIDQFEIEKRYLRPDGEVVWGRLMTSILRDDHARPLYFLSHVEDITEAREAEALRQEMSALKDGFLRVVTHDLGGPLVAIANLAGVVARQSGRSVDEQQQLFGRIANQADRLSRMVATFLDAERLYRGGLRARRDVVDVAEVARRVAERAQLGGRFLCLEETSALVHVDPEQFEHILENLLDHAAATSPALARVWLVVEGDGGGGVSVALRHDGPVPPEQREVITSLFRGANGALGPAIGLWVVARFVALHGGRVWLEDRPGGSASLQLTLPAAESHLDEVRK